ncbi:MAG: DinB family protein [Betaproteobacteria bacterium]|nr:DinB family protein [Betaproteobacteria bacterium]
MKLSKVERREPMESPAAMTTFLRKTFESLTPQEVRTPGPGGGFSPVEQVWHLADLEREGFALRIWRLQTEANPRLADFDGTKLARERNHRSLSLAAGLGSFEAARQTNIDALQALPPEAWVRSGTQNGVGTISLCDMPAFMHQHDLAHIAEIQEWNRFTGRAADE